MSAPPSLPTGRVLIAYDDGPLEPNPTWTRIDDTDNLVAGYDLQVGRQTLIAQTGTGTGTVYLNDKTGDFDPRTSDLAGLQIALQLWNPVTSAWEPQFRGHIDEATADINPATDANGELIIATVQLNCVDIFDYLAGYGLTPGLDGVAPPAGSEGTIWYAETAGTIDDRVIQVMTDVGIDVLMYVPFSGNVRGCEVNYDSDESALVVLRDCSDAELPFIGNMYPDRFGRFCWHGRESRFDPDTVAAGAGVDAWAFTRWQAGDGLAIRLDADRAQIRVLSTNNSRKDIINAALAYPRGILEADIPGQVYIDSGSEDSYGKHAADPMTDLVIKEGVTTGNDANAETLLYATLLVKNKKDPKASVSALQIKAIDPSDARAAKTWEFLSRCDISDIVNLAIGDAGAGTLYAIPGDSPDDDHYIEGRTMRVRPLNPTHDYVELDLNVSPAVWSMDTHGVFA